MSTENTETLAQEEQKTVNPAEQTAKDEENKKSAKKAKETPKSKDEAQKEEEAQPISPWDEMLEIKLPKASKTEQNFQFVSVNGRVFQVPKGKTVKVPKPVYEVLKNKEAAEEEADSFSSEAEINE